MSAPTARERFDAFCKLVQTGDTVTAIERFYADDVTIFENRELARAGKSACLSYERQALAKQPGPPTVGIHHRAFDEGTGVGFIEYDVRFVSPSGRPMRLEEVAVQRWSGGLVEQERYYYQGFVDEGD